MVHAEKIVTAVQRGVANTRWRDFADIYTLARRHDIDGADLTAAIRRVAAYRRVDLVPLRQVLDGYAASGQTRWSAWRRKHRLDDRLPERLDEVVSTVIRFADGAIGGSAADAMWDSAGRAWTVGAPG